MLGLFRLLIGKFVGFKANTLGSSKSEELHNKNHT